MTFQRRALVAAIAVATLPSLLSAAECNVTVIAAPAEGFKSPMEVACPTLFLTGENAIDPTRPETITTESLKKLEPCKETTCLTELKTQNPADCTVDGLNIKVQHEATIKLCEAFNAGPVTVAAATSMLEPVFKGVLPATTNSTETTPAATTSPVETTKPTEPTTAPTTVPKSGASGVNAATGATVVVTLTAIHWLV